MNSYQKPNEKCSEHVHFGNCYFSGSRKHFHSPSTAQTQINRLTTEKSFSRMADHDIHGGDARRNLSKGGPSDNELPPLDCSFRTSIKSFQSSSGGKVFKDTFLSTCIGIILCCILNVVYICQCRVWRATRDWVLNICASCGNLQFSLLVEMASAGTVELFEIPLSERSGPVRDYQRAEEILRKYETATVTKFTCFKVSKGFGNTQVRDNRPFHGFRPPFCWVGKEIKERLPSPIQILL